MVISIKNIINPSTDIIKLITAVLYLGQSEVLISDIYEFWPPTVKFNTGVQLELNCRPINEGEEVVLKINGDVEVPVFKEKQPFVAASRRNTIIAYPPQNSLMDTVSFHLLFYRAFGHQIKNGDYLLVNQLPSVEIPIYSMR